MATPIMSDEKHMYKEESGSLNTSNKDVQEGVVTTEALDFSSIDPAAEKRLVRKLDLWIAPLMVIFFLVAYLDRSNIGNAAIAGMNDDLNLTGTNHLNVAVSIFYVTYIMFELPLSLVLKKARPQRLIPSLIIGWSLVVIGSAFVQNYAGLIATRLLLGVFESGLFPCLTLYLSTFYDRNEQARRVSYLFVAAALSGGLGGLLAYGLTGLHGAGGLAGWRWLFLVEGLISIVVGIAAIFMLADNFETAWYLNEDDKALMRLRQERSRVYQAVEDHFEKSEVKRALGDSKVWLNAVCQFMADICSFGFSTFLPTIIKALGFSSVTTQLLTVPVYFFASFVYLVISYFSDRVNRRAAFIVPMGLITLAGYSMMMGLDLNLKWVLYFACFVTAPGIYCCVGINVTWSSNNNAGYTKRATAIGLQQTIGNLAGIVAGQIYSSSLTSSEGRYVVGHGISLAAIGLGVIGYSVMWVWWRYENDRRDKMNIDERQRALDAGAKGDLHPDFRYCL